MSFFNPRWVFHCVEKNKIPLKFLLLLTWIKGEDTYIRTPVLQGVTLKKTLANEKMNFRRDSVNTGFVVL